MFSKYSIGHATATLARDLLPLGIRVNGIAPSLFLSGLSTGSRDALGQSHGSDLSRFSLQVPVSQLPVESGGPSDVGGLEGISRPWFCS